MKATYLRDGYSRGKNKGGRGLDGWYRDLTVREAKSLSWHTTLYVVDRSGNVRECRLNGKPKTWKRSPGCTLSLKYGLKECFHVGGSERGEEQSISHPSGPRVVVPVRGEFPADHPPEIVTDWVTDHELGG